MSGLPDLQGKVAVVTGGASGIGKGIASQLIASGMRVVIADIEQDALRRTASELGATAIVTDVSDAGSVHALADAVVAELGTVHVVCNNAGVGPLAPIAELTMADWDWVLGVNLYGVIHGVQAFLPILAANPDGGHIVNTASMAGLVAPPRMAAYCVSKFGVVALTEVLAARARGRRLQGRSERAVPGNRPHQHRHQLTQPAPAPRRGPAWLTWT
jgi:NAD(P)-dependent dehydrogenase (short-subunit alcohol dehydrogenase family)